VTLREDIYILILVVFLSSLLAMRGLRIYLRSGLKGEIVRTIGILIFIISSIIRNYQWQIVGLVVFNAGWIILVTLEDNTRKEIFRQSTMIERLTGNVPQILSESASATKHNRLIGVLTGICFLLIALTMYKGLSTVDTIEALSIVVLTVGGIFFIIFYLFKKT
jgi:hypothetical protein